MIQLIHGDCYQEIKKIPDKSIDLVYVDIPYLIENGGVGSSALGQRLANRDEELGRARKKYLKDDTNHKEAARINMNIVRKRNNIVNITSGIDYSIFDEICRVLKHTYIYIWCSKEQILDIMTYFIKEKGCRYNLLVWCKTNPTPATNNMWLPNLEYCLVFKGEGSPKYNDGYELKSKWYMSPINKTDKDIWEHPTIKPLELVERHIKHSTKPGDTVLDCFMGSGTTGVACRNLDRNFIGIEIDQKYFDIAKRRIETQVQQTQLF